MSRERENGTGKEAGGGIVAGWRNDSPLWGGVEVLSRNQTAPCGKKFTQIKKNDIEGCLPRDMRLLYTKIVTKSSRNNPEILCTCIHVLFFKISSI